MRTKGLKDGCSAVPDVLVDAHVHLNNYHEGSPVPAEESCRRLFAKMDEHGVDHAVVITSYKVTADRPGVLEVLELLAGDERATVVEGLRWLGEPATDLFEMEQRIAEGTVSGIKLYPGYEDFAIDDPSLEAVHRLAAKHDVPVVIHTGDTYSTSAKVRQAHPLLVDDVAVEHPGVDYVMCHLGNPRLPDSMCVRSRAGRGRPETVSREHKPEGLVPMSESSSRSPRKESPSGFSTEGDTEIHRSGRRPKGRPQEGRHRSSSIDASSMPRRLRLEVASGYSFVSAPCFRPPEDGETYADDVRQSWLRDTAEVLYKNDNVYADISGLVLAEEDEPFADHIAEEVADAIAYLGDPSSQLLYGSDWPLCAMGPYVDFLDRLDLTPEQREGVAWRTAADVFGIPLDGAG